MQPLKYVTHNASILGLAGNDFMLMYLAHVI